MSGVRRLTLTGSPCERPPVHDKMNTDGKAAAALKLMVYRSRAVLAVTACVGREKRGGGGERKQEVKI